MSDLNPAQVLRMEAGPKFNALVAERVMGWKRGQRGNWIVSVPPNHEWLSDDGGWEPTTKEVTFPLEDLHIPPYSTDPAADYEVLVFVRENWEEAKRLSFGLQLSSILDDRWGANDFGDVETAGYYYQPGDYSRGALLTTLLAKDNQP